MAAVTAQQSIVKDPTPPPLGTPRRGEKALVTKDDNELLPDLKSSDKDIDKTKPLPTTLMSDFLPEDVLFALTQPSRTEEPLGPPNRFRNLNTSTAKVRPTPANVWNTGRRERFKHLTENTPCTCGAGKDISFLYDVPTKDSTPQRPEKLDKSVVRKDAPDSQKQALQLPDTLVPEEYHIVKNKGVIGIEYHEDKYSNQVEDHEKHLVIFPSMKPVSRFEVVQLKNTMEEMLERAGVNDADSEIKGPTQMHNLLELIKKEQNIYNVIFHELIRQSSIECVERGELMATLRGKYSSLLSKVPQQIKSLHEEVMAQRALDRRLTEELMRFKSTISVLTSELSEVKEHDKKVTKEAQQAQLDLKSALSEAQRNASLLAEYHELYELQRRRLESQVVMLTGERELWSTAAYSLAMKVTNEAQLTTAKRLHVSEKAWAKLANHFTILLSDKDTDLLTKIQMFVEKWRDLVDEFSMELRHREDEMRQQLKLLSPGIERWMKELKKCFTKDGLFMKVPEDELQKKILNEIRKWEENLGKETEKFGGDTLLNGQEQLHQIKVQMDGWTDNAMRVFGRHRGDGRTHPGQVSMLALNENIEELLHQFNTRITGENGVATNVIHLMNGMETWDMKLTSGLNGTMPVHDTEWLALCQLMEEWLATIDEAVQYVGVTQSEEGRAEGRPHTSVEVSETIRKVQKWVSTAMNAVDSEDAKLVEQVTTLHSGMINWMVQVLLRLAPDFEGNSKEAGEMALLGSTTLNQLLANAKTLFEQLESFSKYVVQCCAGIVMDNTQKRRDQMEENADHELRDLQKLRLECDDWVKTAKILTGKLLDEPVDRLFPEKLDVDRKESEQTVVAVPDQEYVDQDKLVASADTEQDNQPDKQEVEKVTEGEEEDKREAAEGAEQPSKEPSIEKLEIIGGDDNTHVHNLEQRPSQPYLGGESTGQVLASTQGQPDTGKAFEALAAVNSLQQQLLATEERAQSAEERASLAEAELNICLEKIREFQKKIADTEKAADNGASEKVKSETEKPTTPKTPKTPTTPRSEDKKRSADSHSSKSSSKGPRKKKQ